MGPEPGVSGSREPNFVARKISERRPVLVNHSPRVASAGQDKDKDKDKDNKQAACCAALKR